MNRYKYLKQAEKNILKLSQETPRDELEEMFDAVKKAQALHHEETSSPSTTPPSFGTALKMIEILGKAWVPYKEVK